MNRFHLWIAPLLLLAGLLLPCAQAGELSKADLSQRFAPPQRVGDKLHDIPAWPITSDLLPDAGPMAYAFESVDIAPLPGFEGTPINLLIKIDPKGELLSVELLHQHEPVFLGGLGEEPLRRFLTQYSGHHLRQEFVIASPYGARPQSTGQRAVLDGVSKATASIRVINQTILNSALAVAKARLGFAAPQAQTGAVRPVQTFAGPRDFATLLDKGDIRHQRWRNREVEALFAGSEGARLDDEALRQPEATFTDFYVAYISTPTIGRNLLGEKRYAELLSHLEPGQHAWWVATTGRYALTDENFVRGSIPARLLASQDSAPLGLRDGDLDFSEQTGTPAFTSQLVLLAPPMATVDPSRAVRFELDVVRARGLVMPELIHRPLSLDYAAPEDYFEYPARPLPEWLQAWQGRWPDLLILTLALTLLTGLLLKPRWLSVNPRRLKRFRLGFLLFTLIFIGWHAQGQLSIVQITGAIKALRAGQGLGSFLYDPISLLLMAYTLLTLLIWGRGTFCGWLCPFGAAQELLAQGIALLTKALPGLRRMRARSLPAPLRQRLAPMRFVILGGLIGLALLLPAWAEKAVEIEPFKTAITVGFDRAWPFTLYAGLILLFSALYFKAFCRFLCPLGAALSLGGKLRRWSWLPRREACGQPCQTCRHRCEYDAIDAAGKIQYDQCFQCLDCVGIYHDKQRCAPLIFQDRKGRAYVPGQRKAPTP